MLLLGVVMTAIFIYVVRVPYAKLNKAVAHEDWPVSGDALGRIRQLVGTNFLLGVMTVADATLGRLFFNP